MDRSTLGGLAFGMMVLVGAMALAKVPPQSLLNPEALLIVFGGTLAATVISFNRQTLLNALHALRGPSAEGSLQTRETVQYVMDVVAFVRDEGVLALQSVIQSVDIPFFKKGLQLVLDNRSEKFIRDSLSTELEVIYREQSDYARVFETAGGYAPTMGIIGAVIGLIHVVHALSDPAQLGQGVASAFSATLYGVGVANLILLPLAGKLRQQARYEAFVRTLLMEAVLSIRSGEHPMLIEERLKSFAGPEAGSSYASRPHGGRAAYAADNGDVLPPSAVLDDHFLMVER